MIDNALWQMGGNFNYSLPAGFEAVARAEFKAFVGAWFGEDAERFLGVTSAAAEPPRFAERNKSVPTPLFGAWKVWRARAYTLAAEAFRDKLHGAGIAVLGNTVFWPLDYAYVAMPPPRLHNLNNGGIWRQKGGSLSLCDRHLSLPGFSRDMESSACRYADSEILQHLDGVVSESHDSSAASMALKQELGRVLTQGRPQLNCELESASAHSLVKPTRTAACHPPCPCRADPALVGVFFVVFFVADIATFNQSCEGKSGRPPCPLRSVTIVRGMLVASFIHMGRPWLVAWGSVNHPPLNPHNAI